MKEYTSDIEHLTRDELSREEILSIFRIIPLETLCYMRDVLADFRAHKAHGRIELKIQDGYISTMHRTDSKKMSKRVRVLK